jgi:hypothetical protein
MQSDVYNLYHGRNWAFSTLGDLGLKMFTR